ncbi:early activation antigen CD69-like [Malurus melanocephalus]|uniref:early activation antigen CD69-like n=1 Tax=Malurus melanocephalus TaxID=175006 RepID=UPI002546AF8E|nr:early activation antigen CD69-like [Malurus melanocephalus]
MGLFVSHHRRCQTVSKADLQKAFSALLMYQERGLLHGKKNDLSCELEKSEFCSIHGIVKELLYMQNGSSSGVTLLPQAREATCPKHEGATCQCAVSENVENGVCSRNGSVKVPLGPQAISTMRDNHKSTLRGFLVEWIRSHPKVTLVLILLLLLLLVLAASADVSGRTQTEIPVVPETPLLLACPHGWVGHRRICYFLSRDQLSWDQAQARCSELGASLAVLQDWEMEFLFLLTRNEDHWLGLRRRGRELQWGDGSSFNSSVPVLGNAGCVFLAEGMLRSAPCSNPMPFVCSRAQTHQ